MKRIQLAKVTEFGTEFYSGKMDPREMVRLVDDIQVGETQEAQRPLELKHLKEIARHVGGGGPLPGSVLISTKKNSADKILTVVSELCTIIHPDGTQEEETLYFMEVPETEEEFEAYRSTLNLIDGQHRIISFKADHCSPGLKDNDVYEMTFSLFLRPSTQLRQELFMVTNEKQKPVSPNLLLYLRRQLDLLDDTERRFLPVVEELNKEAFSPLQGRIVMSAEKINKGYKSREVVKILKKTFRDDLIGLDKLSDLETQARAISVYLEGWESYYSVSFRKPKNDTMTKTAGLRFILWLFPLFWETAIDQQKKLSHEFVHEMITDLEECAVEGNSHANESDFPKKGIFFANKSDFKGEGATDKAVKQLIRKYKDYILEKKAGCDFDPMA
jgi:DGQHR domain-containing protein